MFYAYSKTLFPFILSLVKSEAAAKEIIQDIFLKLWLNRKSLNLINNPGGWLHTIAANSAYTYLRNEARYHLRQERAVSIHQENDQDPYQRLDALEMEALVFEAVKQLPFRRRQVFQLSRIEGLSRKEIARQLNISENTVRNQLVDAVHFVQDYLRKKSPLLIISLLLLSYRF